jgi:hypothetical protein
VSNGEAFSATGAARGEGCKPEQAYTRIDRGRRIHLCASRHVRSDHAAAEEGGCDCKSKPTSRVFEKDHMS